MNPFLPFAILPAAAVAGWFAASQMFDTAPHKYRVPPVQQLEAAPAMIQKNPLSSGNAGIRVDAFLPHVPPKPPAPASMLVLHSVMTGPGASFATINSEVVKEGDEIEGYRVRQITREGVDLIRRGKSRHLPMRPLHELPPSVEPAVDPARQVAKTRNTEKELVQDFWSVFDSIKP